jgi:hypothetical protein
MDYLFDPKETDYFIGKIKILTSISQMFFFPCEHLSFLGEAGKKVLNINEVTCKKLSTFAARMWLFQIFMNFITEFYKISKNNKYLEALLNKNDQLKENNDVLFTKTIFKNLNEKNTETESEIIKNLNDDSIIKKGNNEDLKKEIKDIQKTLFDSKYQIVINLSNIYLAVHYSLNESPLHEYGIGIFGTIGSLLGLYKCWKKVNL